MTKYSNIAILATGDEIINGDILNTNAEKIAKCLVDNNLNPGQQLTIADDESEIAKGITYLLEQHDALIIMGGLGPTSDDVTRFALAKALSLELIFDEQCWERIKSRISLYNDSIPESNKRQCFFPESATLLANHNGTAEGCHLSLNDKSIFMLPGPPSECLPMFIEAVLPKLISQNKSENQQRHTWLLLDVSESSIAEDIEQLIPEHNNKIGYRAEYPYLEVKLREEDPNNFEQYRQQIHEIIKPKLISTKRQTASQCLIDLICQKKIKITISDSATCGYLQQKLTTRESHPYISFQSNKSDASVSIAGLNNPWKLGNKSNLEITINHSGNILEFKHIITNKGKKSFIIATELICWDIFNHLTSF